MVYLLSKFHSCAHDRRKFNINLRNLLNSVLLKNSLAVKKNAALFKMTSVKKSCEIKGGDQEMAVMV